MRRTLVSMAVAAVLAAPASALAMNFGGMIGGLMSSGPEPSPWTMPHRAPSEASRPAAPAKAGPGGPQASRERTAPGSGAETGSAPVCSCPRTIP